MLRLMNNMYTLDVRLKGNTSEDNPLSFPWVTRIELTNKFLRFETDMGRTYIISTDEIVLISYRKRD